MQKELTQIVNEYIRSVELVCMNILRAFHLKNKQELMEYRFDRQVGEFLLNDEEQKFYFHGLGCVYKNSHLIINWEFGEGDTWCGISPSNIYSYIVDNQIESGYVYDVTDIEKEFEQSVQNGEWIERWGLYYNSLI